MKAQRAPLVESYTPARDSFESLVLFLDSSPAQRLSHFDIEAEIEKQTMEISRQLLQGHLDDRSTDDRARADFDAMGTELPVKSAKRAVESIFGRVSLTRYLVQSAGAQVLQFPLDRALNLQPELYSLAVQQRVAEFAGNVSMDKTLQGIKRTTGANVPKRQVEESVQRAARDFVAFYEQRSVPANDSITDRKLLVMSVDATGVSMIRRDLREPTRLKAEAELSVPRQHKDPMTPNKKHHRNHSKRMATVTAIYDQESVVRTPQDVLEILSVADKKTRPQMPRPEGKMVSATLEKTQKSAIIKMMNEGEQRDPEHRRPALVLVDGAERQLAQIQAEAQRMGWLIVIIVDFIHVLSYLWKAAKSLRKAATSQSDVRELVGTFAKLLLEGKAKALASLIERQAKARKLSKSGKKVVASCVRYLRNHAQHLKYDEYLAAGYPIATGVIEGACRHLVKDRMAITGARWGIKTAEAILRLRALQINGDWDEYWTFHQSQCAARLAAKYQTDIML